MSLLELDTHDLFDVLHYYFEEDSSTSQSAEHAEAKDMLRTSLYENLYNKPYRFASKKSSNLDNIDLPMGDEELPVPIDPFEKSNQTKPYRPPTDFDSSLSSPFGTTLDAPLN